MKRFCTLFTILLIWAVNAFAISGLPPIRISVTNPTRQSNKTLVVEVLNSAGDSFIAPTAVIVTTNNVSTDLSGVVTFVLVSTTPIDGGGYTWGTCGIGYNKDYLIRVTYDGVVLSIERMEVMYAKQGLFGTMIDPGEIAPSVTNTQVLTTAGSAVVWATPTTGTVTGISVASANGFAGSATAAPTPAITISTSITGLLKGDGTAISAASAGTDYLTPSGSAASLTNFPTLNQSTTGTAAGFTGNLTGDVTSTGMSTTIANKVTMTATSPVAVSGSPTVIASSAVAISIADAAADGSTKGAAAFATNDFDAASGVISLDYTNGQAASGSAKGFLTSSDWTTFNGKAPTSSPTFTGTVTLDGATSGYVALQSPAAPTSYTLTLPTGVGTSGQVLTNSATPGVLAWATPTTGTVTGFSSGDLSPLFTTSVATSTTTPALSFTLNTQTAHTVLAGPITGGPTAPTFRNLTGVQIGTPGSDYSSFESDGTLVNSGAATVWKDINLGGLGLSDDIAGFPTTTTLSSTAIIIPSFSGSATNSLFGCFELQHDYKEHSAVFPHVHWLPVTAVAGNVVWYLEYWIIDRAGNVTTGTLSTLPVSTGSSAWSRHDVNFDQGTPSSISTTNLSIGCQIAFRIYRIGGGTGDTYAGGAALLTVGLHYECDTQGSRGVTAK